MAGKLVHFEITAEDAQRAKSFWSSLFGWRFQEWSGPIEYHMLEPGDGPGGAIYPAEKRDGHVIVYFDVDDMDATLEKVAELGGSVIEGKSPIPEIGYFARCRDTEGTAFSLFQPDDTVPMPTSQ